MSSAAGMSLEVETARRAIVRELRRRRKTGGDPWLQKYLGSPYPVLGLSTPEFRAVMRPFHAQHRNLSADEVNRLGAALWFGKLYEEKIAAINLLSHHEKILDERSWRLADGWVDEAIGWALSDSLASGPISDMVFARPGRFRDLMRWTKAKNFWRRRAATYALNRFVRSGSLDRPFQLLAHLLHDEEFWVQRAVGTWLRECWKKDWGRTEAFLRKHVRGLPPVVITVATERAPKSFREELRRRR